MTEFLPFAERWGPWFLVLIYVVAKGTPVILEKLIPDWIAGIRAQKATAAAELKEVYERLITQQDKMLNFIASATMALEAMQRAMDGNTQQLYRVQQSIEHGPDCPLPNCPYLQH